MHRHLAAGWAERHCGPKISKAGEQHDGVYRTSAGGRDCDELTSPPQLDYAERRRSDANGPEHRDGNHLPKRRKGAIRIRKAERPRAA